MQFNIAATVFLFLAALVGPSCIPRVGPFSRLYRRLEAVGTRACHITFAGPIESFRVKGEENVHVIAYNQGDYIKEQVMDGLEDCRRGTLSAVAAQALVILYLLGSAPTVTTHTTLTLASFPIADLLALIFVGVYLSKMARECSKVLKELPK